MSLNNFQSNKTSVAFYNLRQQNSSTNDPCRHVTHVLFLYHQGGEDSNFTKKAIESLVKKLKDRRIQLDFLISAVTSGGKQPTGCVTIYRSLDGRLQIAGRKGIPHVIYARIWRWPNVNKNELIKLQICNTPFEHPDLTCINPFHYDRIVSSGLGSQKLLSNTEYQNNIQKNNLLNETNKMHSFKLLKTNQQPTCVVSHLVSDSSNNNQQLSSLFNLGFFSTTNKSEPCNVSTKNNNLLQQESIKPYKVLKQLTNYSTSQSVSFNIEKEFLNLHKYNAYKIDNLNQTQIPHLLQPEYWCTIIYYELDTQVGEVFKVPKNLSEVIIDGGMDPSGSRSGRFCLGALSNVHRTEASEKARMHIGKGIKLKLENDGSVYLENFLQKGVFVRSYFLDFEHGLIYGSTVHKFCSKAKKKIFDLHWAFVEMKEQQTSAQMAIVAQAYAVSGTIQRDAPSFLERAGIGVDDLRRVCCTIAISFVKGWGLGYNRFSIKETPCWIEIHLHQPLLLLDFLLQKAI